MLLSAFTGKVTLAKASAEVSAFYRKDAKNEPQLLAVAIRDPRSGVRQRSLNVVQACEYNRNMGTWFEAVYEVPEYSFVSINFKRRDSSTGRSFGYEQAAILLRMRESAALRQIRMGLPNDTGAARTAGYFEGRFDIIPRDRMDDFEYDPGFMTRYFDPEQQAALFELSVIEREIVPLESLKREVLTTNSGKEVVITKARVTRKIKLRDR